MVDPVMNLLTEMLDRSDTLGLPPARWPAVQMDRLIDDWRQLATDEWHAGNFIDFTVCAGFAFVLRNARFMRRVLGLFGGYR